MVVVQLFDELFSFFEVDCVGEELLLVEAVDHFQENAADEGSNDADAD